MDEEVPEGFEKVVTGNNISNTYIPELTKVSGEKTWNMQGYSEELMPESITVYIKDGETTVDTLTVTAGEDNKWTYESKDLPKFRADGTTEIIYTVDEEVPAGFEKVVTGTNIENTYIPELTKISGEKTWNMKGYDATLMPESITVYIKDGETTVDTLTVTAGEDNKWTYESKDLPKYRADGTTEIIYTVDEEVPEGFEKVVTGTSIVNTLATVEVKVTKIWDDNENKEGLRPDSVTVYLMKGSDKVSTVELNKNNNWTYNWQNLLKYEAGKEITYTVSEAQVANYKAPVIAKVSDTEWAYTVTNARDYEETEVKVTKVWDDNNNEEGFQPASVKVNLMKGNTVLESVELNAKNNWSYSWEEQLELQLDEAAEV